MKYSMDWQLLSRFLGYLKPHQKLVFVGILAVPFSILSSVLLPWLIIRIIDDKLMAGTIDGLDWMILGLCAVLMVNYAADAIYTFFLQKAGQLTILDLRMDMFHRVLKFPRSYYDKTPVGVTLTRLTSDLEAIGESFAMGVLNMIKDTLITLALLIFLFSVSWKLTLVVLLVVPPVYFITQFIRKRLRVVYNRARVILSRSTGFLQECLNGIKTIQLYSAEEEVESKYEQFTDQFFKAQTLSNLYDAALFSIVSGITTITIGLMIWYGAGEVLAGWISLGILIGFINTLDKIFIPIRDFTSQIADIQRALAGIEHIEELFEQALEEEQISPEDVAWFENHLSQFENLEFENVKFKYKDDGPDVLRGISFTMKKGDQIALVGSTGSGKSTILRILTKTYSNYQGSIKINGIELSRIPKKVLEKLFSLMQQEVFLFDESLSFNISLGREGIDQKDVAAAARYVYAHEFIETLPEQYDFMVRDNGSNLSSGQAQLISFARAIAGGSEIIMLDEATSSVDSVTEHLIQKAIDRVFQEKTVIAIAHRLSTIQHSDQILVLEHGVIKERGSHQQLLKMRGIYANLVQELDPLAIKEEVA
ncbi:MAG: ABC transporter ATP-binding protein [SAR324 cluster bacterium]|nr:ABC transporter ATP-binding protein [SAR324 cluster bacterium]